MTVTAEPSLAEPAPARRRRRRGLWIALAAVLVLVLVAGAVTGTVWYRHYADAPSLTVQTTELGWLRPDGALSHDRTAGPYTADIAPIRQGKLQGFRFWVHNPSSVTQTVLGIAHPGPAGVSVRVSTRAPGLGPRGIGPYVHAPVDIPPHATREVRYYVRVTSCNERGGGPGWTSVDLRVRIGRFLRHETLSLGGDFEYDLIATATTKPC